MSPIRFEFDGRRFGVLRFILPKASKPDKGRASGKALQKALGEALEVSVETKRERLFGPQVQRFRFQGETVTVRAEADGPVIDTSAMDDEARETLIEALRHSFEFTQV